MHDNGNNKISLIYICGTKFCGSTLLDLILGSHSLIESVGEVQDYKKIMEENGICTCLRKIHDCPYWQKINKTFYEYLRSKLHKESINIVSIEPVKVKKTSIKILWKGSLDLDYKFVRDYAYDNYYLFKSILENTNKRFIVDSSKMLSRLVCLYVSQLFNIKVIHLIRECQGFLHACKQRKYGRVVQRVIDSEGNIRFKKIHKTPFDGPVKTAIGWYLQNISILKFLMKISFKNAIIVRYKDLALNPEKELTRICSFIGVPFERNMLEFGKIQHHNLGGNPMRINKKQTKEIKYDDAWKFQLSKYELLIGNFWDNLLNKRLALFLKN